MKELFSAVLFRFQSAPVHFQGPLLAFLSLIQIQYGRRDDVTDYFFNRNIDYHLNNSSDPKNSCLHTRLFIDNHPCLAKMPQNKICRVWGIRTAAILKICKLWVHIWVFFVFQKLPTSLLCVNQAEKLKSDLFYPSYNSPKVGTPQNMRHFGIMLIRWPIYYNGKKYFIVFDSELF